MKFTKFWIFLSCAISTVTAFGQVVVSNSTDITQDADLGTSDLFIGYSNSDVELSVDGATLTAWEVGLGVSSSATNNTLSFDGGVGTFSSYLTVGSGGSENELIIDDDSTVTSYHGIIGYSDGADGNSAEVTDDSSWDVTSVLTVGEEGAFNSLYIADDSAVTSHHGIIGNKDDAEGNSVVVTDESSWDVTDILTVGEEGALNSLQITDESAVTANTLNIGVLDTATSNTVLVSDSTLDVADSILVGKYGGGNQLVITNGGTVSSAEGGVGSQDDDYEDREDDDNTVLVTGEGSSWTIDGDLGIGTEDNTGNFVVVTNGGSIAVDSLVIVGEDNGFDLNKDGLLTVASDFNASMTGFSFNVGSALYVGGELTGMTNSIEEGRTLGITEGGNWDQSGSNVTVGGSSSDSALVVENGGTVTLADLQIGAVSNTGNSVVVSSDGKIMADHVAISGTDNTLTVTNGGWLMVDNDFNAGMTGFEFGPGGVLETTGTLTGMTNTLEDAREIRLSGGSWDVGNELVIGASTSSNAVYVTGGGLLTSAEASIGGQGQDNMVWIQGVGSRWDTEALEISGSGNSLTISDGALVNATGALLLQNNATLSFSSNGTATAGSYFQDSTSVLEFNSITNVAFDPGDALVDASGGTVEFETDATIAYTGVIGDIDVGVTNSRHIASFSSLVVGGVTNASGTDLDLLNGIIINGLLEYDFISQSDELYMQFFRQSLAESAGFQTNTQMYVISDEIDLLATDGNQAAVNQLEILGTMSGAQQNTQLTQLYEQTAPAYAHMDGMLDGMRQVKSRGIMPDSMWPVGPNGPHLYGRQVQVWMKGYGTWASRDGEGANSSYDQSIYGVVLGFDKAFGDILVGLAGGYASSDISQDNGDSSKAGTGYGVLYSSWGTSDWFADGSVAFGLGSVENDSGTVFDTSSETDASQFAYNLSGGKEMVFMEDRMFLTPSAGILGGLYSQDAYTEKSSNAVAKQVDSYSRWSFQSELGVQAAYHKELKKNVLMPEVHANWLHQFNTDADQLGYSLVGGTGGFNLDMQAPVSDLFEVGVGLTLWSESKKGTVSEWVLGLDSRFGDGYSATAFNARLVLEF
ncbi:autotransporter domain-containing protein [Pontiellaceae bacterium B1224]|nr:autotransporter domain-containing protein [Pontiellaceae bacterium B1224]